MDHVPSVLLSFPPPELAAGSLDIQGEDRAIRAYISALGNLGDSLKEAVLGKPEDYLQLLDPNTNTIGCLVVLDIILTASSVDNPPVLVATAGFLRHFEPRHVRYVGSPFLSILDRLLKGRLFPPAATVELVTNALLRVDPTGSVFTSHHRALANLAYESNHTETVLPLIDRDITSFPALSRPKDDRPLCHPDLPPAAFISVANGMTHEIKANTILEYEYLCGLIYLSRRDWSKALGAFERAVTHPSKDKGVSKIQTDAYRKWLLVGLLANGRAPTLPSYTSSSAKAAFANLAAPYNSIAQLFSTPEAAQLKTEAESNSSVWEEDGNQSLVNEVLSSYQKWQIVYLRSIYNQLSVSTILECTASAETGGPLTSNDEIVRLIEGMFESGMLKGQLHVDSGVTYLQFHTEVEAVSEAAFSQELIQAKESIMVVTKEYNAANAALGSHPEYVKHVAREQRRFEKEADDPMEHFESQIEEEDLMADVVATG